MSITASQLKEIRQEFNRLKPSAVTLDGNRAMTVKRGHFHPCPEAGTDKEALTRKTTCPCRRFTPCTKPASFQVTPLVRTG